MKLFRVNDDLIINIDTIKSIVIHRDIQAVFIRFIDGSEAVMADTYAKERDPYDPPAWFPGDGRLCIDCFDNLRVVKDNIFHVPDSEPQGIQSFISHLLRN